MLWSSVSKQPGITHSVKYKQKQFESFYCIKSISQNVEISQKSKLLQSSYSQGNTLHIIAVVGVTVIIVNMPDNKVVQCSLSAAWFTLS